VELGGDEPGVVAQLDRLEERLLYASNTQVAVFVSLAEGETFRLDSVQIQIDGELAAHHIYSFKELEALQKGGVQRIYTGNIPTGEHRIEVSVEGWTTDGTDTLSPSIHSLTFTREQAEAATSVFDTKSEIPVFARVVRHIRMGLDWQVITTVTLESGTALPALLTEPSIWNRRERGVEASTAVSRP